MDPYNRKEFLKAILGGGAAALFGKSIFSRFIDSKPENPESLGLQGIESNREWRAIRRLFPLQKSINYFNTAGLGACPNSVLEKVSESLLYEEVHSSEDRKSTQKLKISLGKFIGADPENLAFIRNTTEGFNIVAREMSFKKGDEILTTTHEHIGGASPWLMLEKEMGIKLILVELDKSGRQNLELIKSKISPNTKLLSISHVTCTTGMVLPIKEISQYCKSLSIPICVDGAQAAGLIPVNIKELDVDFYASSGHKWLLGPKGTGFLYVNKRALFRLKPIFSGAYSDEYFNLKDHHLKFVNNISRLEYGTRNMALVHGLIEGINFHNSLGFEKEVKRNEELATYLKSELKEIKGVEILSPLLNQYSSSIVTFKLKGIDYIKLRDILFSSYQQRTRGIYENNLKALRLSIAIYNNKNQIDSFIEDLKEISDQL